MNLNAQNLIVDGSFENCTQYFDCDWMKICESPDIFIGDLSQMVDPALARKGNEAYDGENYLGMFLGYKGEFVIGRISESLEKGVTYQLSAQVIRSKANSHCDQAFSGLSVWLLDSIPKYPETKWGLSINSRFILLKGANDKINNTENWELVAGEYKAKGDEKYILLGNFKGANLDITRDCEALYYYFDDLKMEEIPTIEPTPQIGETIVLENIFFESGKANLTEASNPALSSLVKYLQQFTNRSVEIRGHTDNVGSNQGNQKLSEDRAQAVYLYLLKNGIQKANLNFKGFGEKIPIADNNNDEGRRKNRRVELVFLN